MATIRLETEKYYLIAQAAYEKRQRGQRRRQALWNFFIGLFAGVAFVICLSVLDVMPEVWKWLSA